ncbi:MAG: protein phosphatase 2C domain-containing protein [Chloroflexota bacterium]
MRIRARACAAVKAGNAPGDYEDAIRPEASVEVAGGLRCAVADGATETSFAGLWARMLVDAYERGMFASRRQSRTLNELRRQWTLETGSRDLPWYAEEKLRQGAFSTLLGLTIRVLADGRVIWTAIAAGDSCLFQVRAGNVIRSFPLARSDQFTNRPVLLSTSNYGRFPFMRTYGTCHSHDRFYLMTDALACWFLSTMEAHGRPPTPCTDGDRFRDWIEQLRVARLMRNDDVSLLALDLE